MLWPLMNAEAFKAEQMFRKHQLFQESLQRVAECWESELDRSIQWGVGGSDLYAFGLPVLLLRRALGVCSCRICQCVLGWLCAFNHISDFCLFIHQTLDSFLYVSQINFAKEQFKDTEKEWVLLVCIGASSGVGRLTFGKIGDLIPGLKKIYMQVRDTTNVSRAHCFGTEIESSSSLRAPFFINNFTINIFKYCLIQSLRRFSVPAQRSVQG